AFAVAHLFLIRLADQAHHVGQLLDITHINLNVPVSPSTEVGDVLAHLPRIMDVSERHIQFESEFRLPWDYIDEVRLSLVGNVELEKLLGDAWINGENLLPQ